MKIIKNEVGTIALRIDAEMKLEGETLEVFKMFEKIGVLESLIEGMLIQTNKDDFKIKSVRVMGE